MLHAYFAQQVDRAEQRTQQILAGVREAEDLKTELRRQLLEMLGLDPLPERTPLMAVTTSGHAEQSFRVENVHFQSSPGLYVTGNLYLPKQGEGPFPAILYVCGHGGVKIDGISYGNKVHYQHHGAWFARNGYVCLTIDSLQLGEIESIHHGTHRYGMWWWLNRGYTPAGVEAWNCLRSLDYLQSRPEVDGDRLAVTGRSGGGAYSWWIAAIDDRIKAAVPVAGITDLRNHVVDGCVEGHCDCMYMTNLYRWDYPVVAALVAPRPLLISNTDRDSIFPLDGVSRTHRQVRDVYDRLNAADHLGLHITSGPHKDTQELRIHAFRWLNHFLRETDELIEIAAKPFFEPQELQVFQGGKTPPDEINTTIHETFVPIAASAPLPQSLAAWQSARRQWMDLLDDKVFAAWPKEQTEPNISCETLGGDDQVELSLATFHSQGFTLPIYVIQPKGESKGIRLEVVSAESWHGLSAVLAAHAASHPWAMLNAADADPAGWKQLSDQCATDSWTRAYLVPRGIGPTAWDPSEKKQVQYQRRFLLLGETLDSARIWDVREGVRAMRSVNPFKSQPLTVAGTGDAAGWTLYASLYEAGLARLELTDLPKSHRDGPFLLNVRRVWDLPQAIAAATERCPVELLVDPDEVDAEAWSMARTLSQKLLDDDSRFSVTAKETAE